MKIKIATYYFGNNYGALLQSLYLKTFLKESFNTREVDYFSYQPKKLIIREELYPIIKKNPKRFCDGLIRFYNLRKWKKIFIKKIPNYKIDTKFNNQQDISIYGSDEVWNFSNPFFGYDNFFFGAYDNGLKISYAASFGNARPDNINSNLHLDIKKLLAFFKFISVRDEYSYKLLKNEFKINSEIVLDPVFLDDQDDKFIGLNTMSGYTCIVYGNYFTKNQIDKIIKFSKTMNLKILSVGYYNEWADSNIKINPSDFLAIIKKSNYFFTSMFHGVQFAVKFKLNFWYSRDPYRINKLEYFLKRLNLGDREINNNSNFEEKIDYIKMNPKLDEWKIFSKNFLLNAIQSIDNTK